jgi:hypothetical protein
MLSLNNSSYPTRPHSIIVQYFCSIYYSYSVKKMSQQKFGNLRGGTPIPAHAPPGNIILSTVFLHYLCLALGGRLLFQIRWVPGFSEHFYCDFYDRSLTQKPRGGRWFFWNWNSIKLFVHIGPLTL